MQQQFCEICYESSNQFIAIADCGHKFCQQCCLQHVEQKSKQFSDVFCPHENCNSPFNFNQEIMNKLSEQTLNVLTKRKHLAFLSKNQNMKQCSIQNCLGFVDVKLQKKQCNKCLTPHCPKCIKPFHDGPCLLDENDKIMKQMNYQKCPNCSIWVQKKDGCMYIDCKCGVNFCYTCGSKFQDDPCRLVHIRVLQMQIRSLLTKIKYRLPEQKAYYPLLLLKLPLQFLLIILFTIFICVGCLVILAVCFALFCILSPIPVLVIACSSLQKIEIILCILFLPLICALFILLVAFIVIMYPLFRNFNHHQVYDGFDILIFQLTKSYLSILIKIISI